MSKVEKRPVTAEYEYVVTLTQFEAETLMQISNRISGSSPQRDFFAKLNSQLVKLGIPGQLGRRPEVFRDHPHYSGLEWIVPTRKKFGS